MIAHSAPTARPLAAIAGRFGRAALNFSGSVGHATAFFARAIRQLSRRPFRFRLVLEHVQFIGTRSLSIVMLTSAFTGLVLALQGYNALVRFGAERMMGALVALSLIRELAPVLAALMVTARAGSAIAATLGNMRVTEQLDALETMAIDPVHYLIAPRILAALCASPVLTAVFTLTGLAVAELLSVNALGLDRAQFASSVKDAINASDVMEGLTKGFVFSLLMVWIASYRGYHAQASAAGVGQATTRAVVETSVVILAADYTLTALLF